MPSLSPSNCSIFSFPSCLTGWMPVVYPPTRLCCPITQDLFEDPVVTSDGHTYERSAIQKWFDEGKTTSPSTNVRLPDQRLVPNVLAKCLARDFASDSKVISKENFTKAVSRGDVKALQSCNYLPAYLETPDSKGVPPLIEAARNGHCGVVSWLLSVCGPQALSTKDGKHGASMLHFAVNHGHLDMAAFLIKVGADVNATDGHKRTPLHAAVFQPEAELAVKMARVLLAARCDPNAATPTGETPLFYCATPECAKVLIDEGKASVMARNSDGNTLLHAALVWRFKDTVKLFETFVFAVPPVMRRKMLRARDKEGRTVLHMTAFKCNPSAMTAFIWHYSGHSWPDQPGALLSVYPSESDGEGDVNIDTLDAKKNTVLHSLCLSTPYDEKRAMQCLEVLRLRFDSEPVARALNSPCSSGDTPLHLALERKEIGPDFVSQLIAMGADLEMQNSRKQSARAMLLQKSPAFIFMLFEAERARNRGLSEFLPAANAVDESRTATSESEIAPGGTPNLSVKRKIEQENGASAESSPVSVCGNKRSRN